MNIPLFGMVLNIKNFSEEKVTTLLKIFNSKIGEKNFLVTFNSHEKYYKYQYEEKCLIHIYSKEYVSLKEILKNYKKILWKYNSSGQASFLNDGIRCIFKDEDAFWNYEFQEEFFLHPDVTWVNFIAFPIDPSVAKQNSLD